MKGECGESSKVVALDKRDLYLVMFISRLSNALTTMASREHTQQFLHLPQCAVSVASLRCISNSHLRRSMTAYSEKDSVIQVVEEFVQIPPQIVLFHRFGFRHMFVVCLKERVWDSSEHATYCEATGFQIREMQLNAFGVPTLPHYARRGTMGRR